MSCLQQTDRATKPVRSALSEVEEAKAGEEEREEQVAKEAKPPSNKKDGSDKAVKETTAKEKPPVAPSDRIAIPPRVHRDSGREISELEPIEEHSERLESSIDEPPQSQQ